MGTPADSHMEVSRDENSNNMINNSKQLSDNNRMRHLHISIFTRYYDNDKSCARNML